MTTGQRPPLECVEPVEPRPPWLREAIGKSTRSADGTALYYEILPARSPDAPALLLANGLGGRLYTWEPLVAQFAGEYRILTWDYRGLYRSGNCERRRDLAIWKHAEDARAVLEAEGIRSAALVGWSMGVQVALETATAFPERVEGLVLLNGTHGHALETAFQPLFRFPWVARYLHGAIDRLCAHPRLVDTIRGVALSWLNASLVGSVYGAVRRNDRIAYTYRQYLNDIFGPWFKNYLRLFQELDAHSTYHFLPDIGQPALVISGGLDPLTPAYQSFEIARRLRNAEHFHIPLGTHFVSTRSRSRRGSGRSSGSACAATSPGSRTGRRAGRRSRSGRSRNPERGRRTSARSAGWPRGGCGRRRRASRGCA